MGAGTSPPAANFIVSAIDEPDSVPANTPRFTLWHEPHVPSDGSTALNSTVPETAGPDCVSTHVTSSGLNESDPVPVQRPLTLTAVGVGVGSGAAGATGDAGGDEVPQDDSSAPRHATAARAAIDLIGSAEYRPLRCAYNHAGRNGRPTVRVKGRTHPLIPRRRSEDLTSSPRAADTGRIWKEGVYVAAEPA